MATQSRIGWRPYVTQVVNAVDADATAFIAAAGITDLTQAAAISTLVNDLKTYGLWTKMKALYPMVGGSAASHKFNLKDPRDLDVAYRLVFNGGWVHSSTGAKPNGTTGYADTKLIPSVNISNVNSVSISNYSRTQDTSFNGVQIGCYDGSNGQANELNAYQYYSIISRKGGSCYQYSIEAVLSTETNTKGFLLNSRTSSSIFKLFFNNNLLNTNTTIRTGNLPTRSLYIGASNWFNGTNQYSPHEHAFDSIGDGLTDTDASNFYISVQKFQTTLGRHVGTPYVSDPDAIAFLMAAGITDGTQAAAINTLVIRMKADGVWTKMKAIYPFVGGNATSHKWNLKDPRDLDAAFRLVFNGGWTHTGTGAKPNGTTGYANTYLNPKNNLAINSGLGVYSRTNDTSKNQADMGAMYYFPVQAFIIGNGTSLGVFMGSNSSDFISFAETDTKAFYQVYRTNSTTVKSLRNMTSYSNTNLPYSAPNLNVYIGARNEMGIAQDFGLREVAFVYMQENFTDTDALNLYSAVQAFQTTLGRQVNIPLVSDTDAQTFLNAANITSFQQASAVNKLVIDLKAAGVWTKMKAIYPFVGGSAASHKFNLKDPRDLDAAYRLVFNGGWTHTSTGAQPNGTTGYADTFLNEYSKLTSGDNHISAYVNTNEVNSGYPYVIGTYNPVNNRGLAIRTFGSDNILRFYNKNNVDVSNTSANSTGFWLNIAKSNRFVGLKNSTKIIDTIPDNAIVNGMISLACVRWTDIGATQFSSQQQVFASIGDGLTDTEATAFYTAVQTYQTSLGRHVATPVYNNGLVLNLDAGNANSYPGTGTTWFDLATSTNGSLVNSPTFNSNQFTFNGSNQFVNFGNTNNIGTDNVTLVAWVKTIANQDYAGIIGKAFYGDKLGRFSLHTRSGGKLGIITQSALSNVEVTSTQNINTGNWVFVVGIIDRSYGNKLYINGVLDGVSTRDTSGVNWSTTDNFTIGFYNGNGSGYFNGSISNAFMYRRVLTDNEIINLYNSTRGRFGL